MSQPLRILFMGTPDFAVPTLVALCESKHDVVAVVTNPDRQAGRGKTITPPPVKVAAQNYQIPLFQPDQVRKNNSLFNDLKELNIDCAVVVAYGQILSKRFLNLPKFGCLNVHASLLPKYRGASPINAAIIAGEAESGVTIMKMEVGLDTGPMLAQMSTQITPNMNAEQLHDQLSDLGAKMIVDTVEKWCNQQLTPTPQDDALSSYAHLMSKEDGAIDWTKSAHEIHNLVRGVYPWPGAYTLFVETSSNAENHKHRKPLHIKIHRTQPYSTDTHTPTEPIPGKIFAPDKDTLLVQCGDKLLQILELQPAGKKSMTARDFLNGFQQEGMFVCQDTPR